MIYPNFTPFPTLETERLILRKISVDDLDAIFELRSNPNLMTYINRPMLENKEGASDLIQIISNALDSNTGITWGLSLKENKALIGTLGLWRLIPENDRAELGYMIHTDFQGNGYMSEALNAIMKYGFEILQLHSIEAWILPNNTASKKLVQKAGFVQEAHFREDHFFNGTYHDSLVFVKLNSD